MLGKKCECGSKMFASITSVMMRLVEQESKIDEGLAREILTGGKGIKTAQIFEKCEMDQSSLESATSS